MNDTSCAKYFKDNYVVKHVTVFEIGKMEKYNNPGAEAFLAAHHAIDQGIPAWYILDKDGTLLADSQKRPSGAGPDTEGVNVGCPANEQEIDYFIDVLKKTSSLTAKMKKLSGRRFPAKKPR